MRNRIRDEDRAVVTSVFSHIFLNSSQKGIYPNSTVIYNSVF